MPSLKEFAKFTLKVLVATMLIKVLVSYAPASVQNFISNPLNQS